MARWGVEVRLTLASGAGVECSGPGTPRGRGVEDDPARGRGVGPGVKTRTRQTRRR